MFERTQSRAEIRSTSFQTGGKFSDYRKAIFLRGENSSVHAGRVARPVVNLFRQQKSMISALPPDQRSGDARGEHDPSCGQETFAEQAKLQSIVSQLRWEASASPGYARLLEGSSIPLRLREEDVTLSVDIP